MKKTSLLLLLSELALCNPTYSLTLSAPTAILITSTPSSTVVTKTLQQKNNCDINTISDDEITSLNSCRYAIEFNTDIVFPNIRPQSVVAKYGETQSTTWYKTASLVLSNGIFDEVLPSAVNEQIYCILTFSGQAHLKHKNTSFVIKQGSKIIIKSIQKQQTANKTMYAITLNNDLMTSIACYSPTMMTVGDFNLVSGETINIITNLSDNNDDEQCRVSSDNSSPCTALSY